MCFFFNHVFTKLLIIFYKTFATIKTIWLLKTSFVPSAHECIIYWAFPENIETPLLRISMGISRG